MVQFQLKKLLLIVGLLISSLSIYSQGLPRIRFTQIQQDTTFGSVLVSSPTDSNITYSRNFYITSDNILRFYNDTIPIKFYVDSVDATKVNTNLNNVTGVLPVANGGTGATTLTSGAFLKGNGTSAVSGSSNLTETADTVFVAKYLDVDTSTLYVDALNNRVGIGTSSPLSILDIDVNSVTTNRVRLRNSTDGEAAILIQNSETGTNINDGIYLGRTSAINYLWTYENEPWVFATNNTERMRITSTGNVGIGTTSPTTKLGVQGEILSSNGTIGSSGATIQLVGDAISSNGGYISVSYFASGSYGPLRFLTSGTEKARIAANGNVGINTTSPSYKLDVYQGDVATTGHVGGDLRLSGNLSGYANNTYPTLKTNTSAIHFDALGTYTGYISWNSGFVDVSDGTLKTFVEPIQNATDILMNLEGVRYSWADGRDNYATHAGFVAQQVLNHYPEAVTLAETGIYGISSPPLIALAVTTIQEQQAIIEEQSNKIQTLESQILLILQEIDNLKNK